MDDLSKAILETLCYADIFDYPLTADELWKYLIYEGTTSVSTYTQALKQRYDLCKEGYYFLQGRERLVEVRKARERWSREKMKEGKRVAGWLRWIPSIKMAAVSGALAMKNAAEEDDIDLLIVSSAGWLWTTRFLATILVELVAKRRRPGETDFKNKICLNMFLDENHLTVPENERDLFSAHEAAQLKVFWSRGKTYEKFMTANQWVKNYLPNIQFPKILDNLSSDRSSVTQVFFSFIESLSKKLQLYYMRRRRTNEIIRHGYIRFHPKDARGWVLREYEKRLKKYGR